MLVTEDGIVMAVSPLQPWNASYPMLVTVDGMVKVPTFPFGQVCKMVLSLLYNVPSAEQYLALSGDTFIAISLLHNEKALSMLVTEDGMLMVVSPLQQENAAYPMLVTEDGMVMAPTFPFGQACRIVLSLLYNIPSAELYSVLSGETFIVTSLLHSVNAQSPMLITEEGMLMDVSPLHP